MLAFLFLFASGLEMKPLANAGMMLTCAGESVVVDGFFREGVRGYEVLPAALREALETAQPPYDRIRLILATHRHADHFDAASVARHLLANPRARFVGTPQTAGEVARLAPGRAETIAPPAAQGPARFLRVPHNRPHRDTIENTLTLVTLCGQTVAFTGDAEVDPADFAGLALGPIDELVVPWWFLTSDKGRQVVDGILKPRGLWAVHGDPAERERWRAQVREHYPRVRWGGLP